MGDLVYEEDTWYLYNVPGKDAEAAESYFMFLKVVFPMLMLGSGTAAVMTSMSAVMQPVKYRPLLRTMAGQSSAVFFTQLFLYVSAVNDWVDRPNACEYLPKVGILFYVLSTFFYHLILIERARATNLAAGRTSESLQVLRVLRIVTYVSPWLVALGWFVMDSYTVVVVQDEAGNSPCVVEVELYLTILFLLVSISTSIGYLLCFLYPLRKILREKLLSEESVSIVKSIVTYNVKRSVAAALATTVMLFILIFSAVQIRNETSPIIVFRTLTYPLAALDQTVSLIASLSLTALWVPSFIRKWVIRHRRTTQSKISSFKHNQSGSSTLEDDDVDVTSTKKVTSSKKKSADSNKSSSKKTKTQEQKHQASSSTPFEERQPQIIDDDNDDSSMVLYFADNDGESAFSL